MLFAILATPVSAHPSRAIVVHRSGDIYFSDLVRIWRISGNRLQLVREGRGTHSHGMIIDASDAVVWEESRYDPRNRTYVETVWQSVNGRVSRRFGPLQRPPLGLGIARDRQGCTYRVDQVGVGGPALVHRLCPGQRARRLLGTAADEARFQPELVNDIAGVTFAPDGSFLFRHGSVVRSVNGRGNVRTVAGGLARENFGIAFDTIKGLLVAEHGNRRILSIKSGHRRVLATSPSGWGPTGVAIRGRDLLILEASDHRARSPVRMRVRQVTSRGHSRLLASVTLPEG